VLTSAGPRCSLAVAVVGRAWLLQVSPSGRGSGTLGTTQKCTVSGPDRIKHHATMPRVFLDSARNY
jgi:hypothetical protein